MPITTPSSEPPHLAESLYEDAKAKANEKKVSLSAQNNDVHLTSIRSRCTTK
jgi:hypothetical protein